MNLFLRRIAAIVSACVLLSGCSDIANGVFGVNRCSQESDVGSTGWVQNRSGQCYDAVCHKNTDENGKTTGFYWERKGAYQSCN